MPPFKHAHVGVEEVEELLAAAEVELPITTVVKVLVAVDASTDDDDALEEQLGGGGGGDYSEVESDVDEPPPQQQQQQQQQLQQQQKGGTAATAASRRQGEPDVWQQQQQLQQPVVRPVLGKRPSDENIGPAQGCSSRGSGASRCADNPLMAAAGPGRAALQQAPGRSFIRDAAAASVGFERGKYISSGPDGKGGVATAYQGSSNSGGGGRVSVEARRRGV